MNAELDSNVIAAMVRIAGRPDTADSLIDILDDDPNYRQLSAADMQRKSPSCPPRRQPAITEPAVTT